MTTSTMKKIFGIDYYRMKEEDREKIIREQLKANLIIERKLSIVLVFVNVILLYLDITKFHSIWPKHTGYRNLFYLHIISLIGLIGFILLATIRNKYIKTEYLSFDKFLCCGYLFFMLVCCGFMSVNAQLIHGQMSAYIICVFCAASTIIIAPRKNLIIYLLSYIIFIVGLFMVQENSHQIMGYVINSSFLIMLAIVIANINFSNYMNDFTNKKIIFQKNQELKNSHRNLESILKKRTDELDKVNKTLIDEINKRHGIEMDALKTKLAYEQEKNLLSEKVKYEKLRTEFFANLSHELRTPLNVIFSAQQILSLIVQDYIEDEKIEKFGRYLKLIKQNCYRLIRLLGNLIDITKIDVGNLKVNFSNYDIVRLIENITLSVNEYVREKGINLYFTSHIKEKIMACDPDKIERIILNLLSNAVKFTEKNGSIYVNLIEEKAKIIISVKDTGIGIPVEKQHFIFERFVQVDKSIVRRSEGSGIGLSLVKSFVEMHGGIIRLESEEGKGSEFIIELPAKKTNDAYEAFKEVAASQHENVEKIKIEFSDIYL